MHHEPNFWGLGTWLVCCICTYPSLFCDSTRRRQRQARKLEYGGEGWSDVAIRNGSSHQKIESEALRLMFHTDTLSTLFIHILQDVYTLLTTGSKTAASRTPALLSTFPSKVSYLNPTDLLHDLHDQLFFNHIIFTMWWIRSLYYSP